MTLVRIRLIAAALALAATSRAAGVQLLLDVDANDNMAWPKATGGELFGPEQIEQLFRNCREQGISMVFWRCQGQAAGYHSKLTYTLADMAGGIRSNPDERRHGGAFAARVGVSRAGGGIFQRVEDVRGAVTLSGWVSAPQEPGAFLVILDAASGRELARSPTASGSESFVRLEAKAEADGPLLVGAASDGRPDLCVFVCDDLSLLDEEGRERLANGDMEEIHMLQPVGWHPREANFIILNGDVRAMDPGDRARLLPNWEHAFRSSFRPDTVENFRRTLELYDPLAEAVRQARAHGIAFYAQYDPVDDGKLVLPPAAPKCSPFLEEHPEYRLVDREGRTRWGQLCFGYPEVRAYKTAVVEELLAYGVDGIALKMSYQHNMVWDGNAYDYAQFAFNDVALEAYDRRWGRPEDGDYDLERLKIVHGDFFIEWLRELRPVMEAAGARLALFQAPGKRLDAMCGHWVVDPVRIVREGLVDDLLIEPRHSGDHTGLFEELDGREGYVEACREAGVRLGFDYYLSALSRRRGLSPEERAAVFVDQLVAIARSPVDFIGIYEGLNVDHRQLWPAVGEARARIDELERPEAETAATEDPWANRANLAAGARAFMSDRSGDRPAGELADGDITDNSHVRGVGANVAFVLEWETPQTIDAVRLYPGVVSQAANPSGESGLRDYRVQGLEAEGGDWEDLFPPVVQAPRFAESGARGPVSYQFTHAFGPRTVRKIRVLSTRSGDTGRRISAPDRVTVPDDRRSVKLREIEVYAPVP